MRIALQLDYQHTTFLAISGHLADYDADALAVPAGPALDMQVGIARTVGDAAGASVSAQAARHAPAEPGSIHVTGAGTLAARHIMHCVIAYSAGHGSPALLRTAVDGLLRTAREHGMATLALPALGASLPGLDPAQSTEIIIAQTRAAIDAGLRLRALACVVCDPLPLQCFRRAMRRGLKN